MLIINKINLSIITSLLFFFAYSFSFSQESPFAPVARSLYDIRTLAEVIVFIIGTLAFLFFFWNLSVFIRESDAASLEQAKKRMGWGAIAIFVMVSIWGIIVFIGNVLGIKTNQQAPLITLPDLQEFFTNSDSGKKDDPGKIDMTPPTTGDEDPENKFLAQEKACNDATDNEHQADCKKKSYQECIKNKGNYEKCKEDTYSSCVIKNKGPSGCETLTSEEKCNQITENEHQADCKDETYQECISNKGSAVSCKNSFYRLCLSYGGGSDSCEEEKYSSCVNKNKGPSGCETLTSEEKCNQITENEHQADCKDKTYQECISNGGSAISCKPLTPEEKEINKCKGLVDGSSYCTDADYRECILDGGYKDGDFCRDDSYQKCRKFGGDFVDCTLESYSNCVIENEGPRGCTSTPGTSETPGTPGNSGPLTNAECRNTGGDLISCGDISYRECISNNGDLTACKNSFYRECISSGGNFERCVYDSYSDCVTDGSSTESECAKNLSDKQLEETEIEICEDRGGDASYCTNSDYQRCIEFGGDSEECYKDETYSSCVLKNQGPSGCTQTSGTQTTDKPTPEQIRCSLRRGGNYPCNTYPSHVNCVNNTNDANDVIQCRIDLCISRGGSSVACESTNPRGIEYRFCINFAVDDGYLKKCSIELCESRGGISARCDENSDYRDCINFGEDSVDYKNQCTKHI